VNSLAQGLLSIAGPGHGTVTSLSASGSPVYAALNSFLPAKETATTGKPKAYLNWMMLDNQFNYVSGQSGALPVGSSDVLNTLAQGIGIHHSGYLYIWVSNETQGWDVFFDNLSVNHYSGPMVEENHYYAYGLTMAGISDKALKGNYAENKYRFNKGSELQNKEFADGSGLELYETPLRSLDPELGRWWQVDPKTDEAYESVSPYSAMNNNPARYNDPNGDEGQTCCKTAEAVIQFTTQTADAIVKAGGGAQDPVTDAVAAGWDVLGGIVSLGALVYDLWSDAHPAPAMGVPKAPSAPAGTAPPSTQAKTEDKQAKDGDAAKPRNAPAAKGTPNSSKIDAKDKTGKTTKYTTYDEKGNWEKQVEADRGESRHGVPGATKKVPTSNTLPDGTVKPGKPEIKPASPDETPPGTNH
jgi:RHS repeat-associated protein